MRDRESGQAHLLAICLTLPLVALVVLFIVQLSWVGMQQLSLDHALYGVGRTLDGAALTALSDSGSADGYLREAILDDWTELDGNALDVSDASCDIYDVTDSAEATKGTDAQAGIQSYSEQRSYAYIEAEVAYTVPSLFPFPWVSDVTLTRTLDRTQLVSMRFEVTSDG